MPIAQRKTSRTRRDKRRSHHHLRPPTVVTCPNCNKPKLPHIACPNCGFYKGRQVISARES